MRARTSSSVDPGSPADRAPGSRGGIVISGPRTAAATSTRWKRSGATGSAALGALDPTGPGTATVAKHGDERHARDDSEASHVRGTLAANSPTRGFRRDLCPFRFPDRLAGMPSRIVALDGPLDLAADAAARSRAAPATGRSGWRATRPGWPSGRRLGRRIDPPGPRGTATPRARPGARARTTSLEHAPGLVGLGLDRRGPLDGPDHLRPRPRTALSAASASTRTRRRHGTRSSRRSSNRRSPAHAARRAWFGLVRTHGEDAPGPVPGRAIAPAAAGAGDPGRPPLLRLPPVRCRARRAELIRRVAPALPGSRRSSTCRSTRPARGSRHCPGWGRGPPPRSRVRALGDPDAVSVGDFHLKNLVSWALAREPRGTDERMLELLEPYAGQRAHVVRCWSSAASGHPLRSAAAARSGSRASSAVQRVTARPGPVSVRNRDLPIGRIVDVMTTSRTPPRGRSSACLAGALAWRSCRRPPAPRRSVHRRCRGSAPTSSPRPTSSSASARACR